MFLFSAREALTVRGVKAHKMRTIDKTCRRVDVGVIPGLSIRVDPADADVGSADVLYLRAPWLAVSCNPSIHTFWDANIQKVNQ